MLLMTAATGAWADETPLTTITPTGKDTYSETTAGVVTVTPSNMRRYSGDYGWLWKESGSVTVEAKEGYTITKCVFKQNDKDPVTITTSPFAITFDGSGDCVQNDAMDGVTSIEVYGAAAASGYTVSLKDGVKDADKWTISPNPAEEGQTVTLQYTGRLKVKGVTATSDEKPAEASVPDGAINGKFSVSSTKKVYFSKGNLRYASSKWSFFDNQYDYYTSYSADAWDHFGWSTSATTYGMSTSSSNGDYSGDFVDWGATMGAGWRTLTSDEWAYLLKTRSASTVNGTENGRYAKAKVNDVGGVILFPDTYTHPDGVAAPTGVNATDEYGWEGNSYTAADWTKMESAGCVFLPAAGCRYGSEMIGLGSYGYYGSATPDGADYAYRVKFNSGSLEPANSINRCLGCSVRLVQAVSDAAPAAKEPATVTTAPKGAEIVGVGKTTALVSGGVADGGTLMYAVTTTNTKPTSTDGFSDAVPTAQTITASGTVYVWYYVKGDDTHSDSEIAATAIEVPVADIVWDVTNVSDLFVYGTSESYEKEGVTLSGNADNMEVNWVDFGDPTTDGIAFQAYETGGYTFTAPAGKAFTKIEMNATGSDGWDSANLGTGWALILDKSNNSTVTWTGTAASTVKLLTDDGFEGDNVKSIAFTVEPSAPAGSGGDIPNSDPYTPGGDPFSF